MGASGKMEKELLMVERNREGSLSKMKSRGEGRSNT